jgi:hypothetical protein
MCIYTFGAECDQRTQDLDDIAEKIIDDIYAYLVDAYKEVDVPGVETPPEISIDELFGFLLKHRYT